MNITTRQQAEAIINDFGSIEQAIKAVHYILSANPHSNPLNSELKSTYYEWLLILNELKAMKQ
jgi:hypothetical protein